MKAAQSLLALAAREGVRACFANPGTSEMHLVAALDSAPDIYVPPPPSTTSDPTPTTTPTVVPKVTPTEEWGMHL